MRSPFVEMESMQHRLDITALMESHGFMHYPFEFWHYSKGDAMAHLLTGDRSPARYGAVDWDPRTNEVAVVENAHAPLNPLSVLEAEITAAIERGRRRERSGALRIG